ncbi:MAG: DUF1573 domain-containing protein [Bacteroidetes bacterium]|nr:DUF1573 domain-containing protein [Bacteroidota bacterium]MBP7398331.1 DUF1573 domain-containing protein [Chitinophagales bacterium]MBK8487119.1 DUF1573 domain-containing protein [Bacteroidota bacterium]MBK8680505.1 DUF1573 domain-containing protein [Bacteroidota bacterium]MBP8753488.1 DUF1573 domain-containing protein [Chitinophagales bacterium]
MKKLFSIIAIVSFSMATIFAQELTEANPNAPEFKWVEETHDFGTIPQSVPVTNKFYFENVGKEPLIVSNVQKTCGCTVTDWTKEPVMPGQKGFVAAEFNAAKEGPFTKAITVQSNSKTPNVKLYFKGTVQKAEQTGSVPEQKTIFNSDN